MVDEKRQRQRMSNFTYSGIIVRKDDVGYGVLSRERQMSVVIAAFPDRSYHCLSAVQVSDFESETTNRLLDLAATNHRNQAFKLYCESIAARFVPEMTAYIRGLPMPYRAAQVEQECVRNALVNALKHEDAFRAAVSFETCIPYLLGDENLVESMRDVLKEARRDYDPQSWLKEAAVVAEMGLMSKNGPIGGMIQQYRQSDQAVKQTAYA
jgi:hypothetical protein